MSQKEDMAHHAIGDLKETEWGLRWWDGWKWNELPPPYHTLLAERDRLREALIALRDETCVYCRAGEPLVRAMPSNRLFHGEWTDDPRIGFTGQACYAPSAHEALGTVIPEVAMPNKNRG